MNRRDLSFFEGIEMQPAKAGDHDVELPGIYRDGGLLGVFWRVRPEAAASVLPDGLEPVVVMGKGIVLVAGFDYRDTSLGPYGEFGVAVLAKRRGAKISTLGLARDLRAQEDQALFVVNLPVTTELTCAAGREIWGYPKYVTEIPRSFEDGRATIAVDGEVELVVDRLGGPRATGLPFVTFTLLDGRLIRTIIETNHRVRWGRAASIRVTGEGPTAETVRALELEGSRPIAAFRTDAMQAILPAGKDLGSL